MTLRAMPMLPERRAGVTAWLLLMLALWCRCSPGDEGAPELPNVTVLISVEGVTPDLHGLHVRSTLNGVSAKNEQDIVNNLSAFVAYLPPGSRGTATFEVSGVTTNLCQTATGTVAGVLPEEAPYRLDLTVRLSPTATTTCPLMIEVTGQGTVTSEPPGVSCDQAGLCRISVLQGSRVTLSAAPDPRSYDFAWGAPCAGAATCSVTVNEETRVPLTFGARGCTDGWCWYNGIPQGNTLRAIWGASPTDLWIVGAYGTLLHYDGRSYGVSPQSGVLTRNDLYGVWGTAANNIWAVGDAGTLLHYKVRCRPSVGEWSPARAVERFRGACAARSVEVSRTA